MEKKDHRKIMLEAMYQAKHFAALERKDEVKAQKYLKLIDKLNEQPDEQPKINAKAKGYPAIREREL